ncbi:MAG: GmrSD restriction endonuclease domain-containing protein [Pyrinomonadaceae bacterium]
MKTQKYAVNQYLIESVLSKVREGEIAIPEIQRPFVWDSTQVRDLLDSLYQGFPIGYLIAWRNPDVRLKDGSLASGKMILIDGQQRVTALTAAILGQQVVNKHYKKLRISIAFQPVEERFEVQNPAILKDPAWISDLAPILSGEIKLIRAVTQYLKTNPGADSERVEEALSTLTDIPKKQIGLIELAHDLDIETVTEIFIRINSMGTVLSQADFAMSKIASDSKYGGPEIRKCVDYFSHFAVAPEAFSEIKENDSEFAKGTYFAKMAWLKDEKDDIYDPSYTDILRVAFTSEFNRGKLADLVSLLSGRNFETKVYEESIAEDTFKRLGGALNGFIREAHFKRFVMIIKSAGYVSSRMIRSQNALNFAYILFLKLRAMGVPDQKIEGYVRRWFVLSVLTGRYSSSPESQFDSDIRQIAGGNIESFLSGQEQAELSPAYWEVGLLQDLETSQSNSPQFWAWVAAQVKTGAKGFLSRDIRVEDLVSLLGDIHHIFPKDALKKAGVPKALYNQIANYAFAQEEVNIRIGKRLPREYMSTVRKQCEGGSLKFGSINDAPTLEQNLGENCVPSSVLDGGLEQYEEFLAERRKMMAKMLRAYYKTL